MNYPLQALTQMGVVPPVNFPADSRYYGSGTLQLHGAERAEHSVSGAEIRAATRRSQLCDGRAALRAAGRPAGPDRRKVSRRSAGLLADLRCQRSDSPSRSRGSAGKGAGHHHAAGRPEERRVLKSVQLTPDDRAHHSARRAAGGARLALRGRGEGGRRGPERLSACRSASTSSRRCRFSFC